jgi:hypothetical protein
MNTNSRNVVVVQLGIVVCALLLAACDPAVEAKNEASIAQRNIVELEGR